MDRYLQVWDPAELHFNPESFPWISARSFFGGGGPLSLDLGCGTGEFFCELARRRPDELFIGIDNAYKPLARAAMSAAAQDLDNLLFLRADVRQVWVRVPGSSLRGIYIQFPVPGPAARKYQPRLFDDEFVAEVARALEPHGRLSVLTDREAAYNWMLQTAGKIEALRRLGDDEFTIRIDKSLQSHNYAVWIGRGRAPHQLEFIKSGPG
ncbi:MAG: methyltransferase domain-containing protein [Anaerolineales bacterium]|nr:methyltransferase domain-containing protein [Anaerolineales bacterium]